MAGRLTTHALDTAAGVGAAGMRVALRRGGVEIASAKLDDHGRAVILDAGLERGGYELAFHAADYHRARGVALTDPPFLDVVTIAFGVADPQAHYHVPLLLSPYAYSTYRGS
jgi:hydroxyisourate hydrolase